MNPASEPINVCWDTPGKAVGEAAVELELPASAPYHAVGRLVVGGVARSRICSWPSRRSSVVAL
ncbi:MAG: hypothetical protein E6G28_01830 [Actinobacteria bacterium]|nr:MAG: hypothetical protein E6G28_01830 [Actinomycetota bacterium]